MHKSSTTFFTIVLTIGTLLLVGGMSQLVSGAGFESNGLREDLKQGFKDFRAVCDDPALRVKVTYDLGKASPATQKRSLKQTIRVKNPTQKDKTTTLHLYYQIDTDRVVYEGKEYALPEKKEALDFRAHEELERPAKDYPGLSRYVMPVMKGASLTFPVRGGYKQAVGYFSWSDVAKMDHRLLAYEQKGDGIIDLQLKVSVGSKGEAVIDPDVDLAVPANYNEQFVGAQADWTLSFGEEGTQGGMAIGDLNGDGIPDLVIGDGNASYNGGGSGSVYIIYGGLVNFPLTMANQPDLNIFNNFDIRYDGPGGGANLGFALAIGDLNNDNVNDLVMGGGWAVWVKYGPFAGGPGAVVSFANPNNYNVEIVNNYAGAASFAIGDINGDNINDLAIGDIFYNNFAGRFISGSVFTIDGPLPAGPAAILDLNNVNNYDHLYVGAAAEVGMGQQVAIADVGGGAGGNTDGHPDLIMSAPGTSTNGKVNNGAVYVIYGPIGGGPGVMVDMNNINNCNVRFDGAQSANASEEMPYTAAPGDLGDGIALGFLNGNLDLAMGAAGENSQGRNGNGSVYIVYSNDNPTNFPLGNGNDVDLNLVNNFNIRLDGDGAFGAYATDFGDNMAIGQLCFSCTPVPSLAIGAGDAGSGALSNKPNNIWENGVVWVTTGPWTAGKGQIRDIANPAFYTMRYYGVSLGTGGEEVGGGNVLIGDLTGNGTNSLVMGAGLGEELGRPYCGDVYVENVTPCVSNTNTSTATSTYTSTNTGTATPTHTISPTSTATNTPTSTATITVTATITLTSTSTNTATPTATVTTLYSFTFTYTATETGTPTTTPTPLPTSTNTNTFTESATTTTTYTPLPTSTMTNTATITLTSTVTVTSSVTLTSSLTWTPSKTQTQTHTATVTATNTPVMTNLELKVYDEAGEVVKTFSNVLVLGGFSGIQLSSGSGSTIFDPNSGLFDIEIKSAGIIYHVPWDGKSDLGYLVDSGQYVLKADIPGLQGNTVVMPLTVLKSGDLLTVSIYTTSGELVKQLYQSYFVQGQLGSMKLTSNLLQISNQPTGTTTIGINIFSSTGQLMADGLGSLNQARLTWDGTTALGNYVQSGEYLIKIDQTYNHQHDVLVQSVTVLSSNLSGFMDASVYPNPYLSTPDHKVWFKVALQDQSSLTVRIYDVVGELVNTLSLPAAGPGIATLGWDVNNTAAGLYVGIVEADSQVSGQTQKKPLKISIIK